MNSESRILFYLDKCIQYNVYAVIEVLFYYEDIEDYRECSLVIKALRRYNTIYDCEYPTTRKGYHSERVAKYLSKQSLAEVSDYKNYIIAEVSSL